MSAPRLEIDLGKIEHNARVLVERLAGRGISVTGVTKAGLGSADIASALLHGGASGLGDSRVANIEAMQSAGIAAPMTLIRSPMLSEVDRVVRAVETSFNTELSVIAALSGAAGRAGRLHEVVLMVELGDLREGIMPSDLVDMARAVLRLPGIRLAGIGANLACQGGVAPDVGNMAELSALAESVERTLNIELALVSGGNSANLDWVSSGADTGRVNNLRLGEAVLLGCEPLRREAIRGLHQDAFTLVAEVIESKIKPSRPWGTVAQTAFGPAPAVAESGDMSRAILAVGHQDVDPSGLRAPPGIAIMGASGDHLIVHSADAPSQVGDELRFGLNYSALVRAMTSPFVLKVMTGLCCENETNAYAEYKAGVHAFGK
ncbi:MAG: alanine/ornithine racemase family PLP-dependent enzyme [Xanthomonadales bacterium]|nr:alanine/ornithine racemase family PLP-dependent enzyme [Xanthomonadales bacterium]